jgi:type I restriction enzyme S subunit
MKKLTRVWTLDELILAKKIKLGRGNIISKKDIASFPGEYPIYSSAREKNGTFGYYGKYMFDEELITWSIDGGGRLFYRPRHKFSVTNVGGTLGILDSDFLDCRYLHLVLTHLHSKISFDWVYKAHPSVIRMVYNEIPVPSLEKQLEVVEKLDSAFSEIDLLEGNLVLGDAKANQLLQSILSSAFNQSSTFSEQSNMSATNDLDIKLIKLVDLCKLVGGGTPSKANSNYYSGGIPWATVRDMRSRWLEDTEHKINETAVKESSTNVIPSGNVVLASRVGLGKVIQLKQDTAINQDLRALIPRENSKIDSNYLYYWTLSITPEIIAAGKGATVQGVTLPFLENLQVPLPSFDKQVEIAKKLDSAFGEIELLKARIKNGKEYVVALRQSLLNSSFTQEEAVV